MKKLILFTIESIALGSSVFAADVTVTTQEYLNQPGLSTINALSAYNAGLSGSGVKIGIVDSGINPNHVEFNNAIVAAMGWQRNAGTSLLAQDWKSTDGKSNYSSFLNDLDADGTTVNGHGSFVSSVAAARLDNASRPQNIMGVAYNSQLVIGQIIFDQCVKDSSNNCLKDAQGNPIWKAKGLSDEQTAQTIDYVSSQGVKVINNSWGSDPSWDTSMVTTAKSYAVDTPKTTEALKRAIDRGSVIVFAAGNESIGWPGAPGTLPSTDTALMNKGGWIVVASTTNRGINPETNQIEMAQYRTQLAAPALSTDYYTNYCGDAKNYCISAPGGYRNPGAPGADVGMTGALASSTDSYDNGNGTSYAAPVVTGAVSLVAEKFPWMTNKNLSVTVLTTGTTAANPSDIWGRGLLDVGKAINGPAIFEEDFEASVSGASTFSNAISGNYGLKKLGVGALSLTGANTYKGNTSVSAGTLILGNTTATGSGTLVNDATVNVATGVISVKVQGLSGTTASANFSLSNLDATPLAVAMTVGENGASTSYAGVISGSGSLTKVGSGSLSLLNTTNTFTGETAINGGMLEATSQGSLGDTNSVIKLNGGTLKLGNQFSSLTRHLYLDTGGGTLNINKKNVVQGFDLQGNLGQFGVTGGGELTLNRVNSQLGGLAIGSATDSTVTTVIANNDNNLGATKSKLTLDQGRLNLATGFVQSESGKFNRPIDVGSSNGSIDTSSLALAYTGGEIGGTGKLNFIGTAFTMGADLKLNAYWGGNLDVLAGYKLSGTGGVDGNLTVSGTLAPGNSPGTMTVSGNVVQNPSGTFQVQIDGTGTGTGAGNYDRIVLTGATSTYTAGGTLETQLRGISGSANNNYSPPLGQGFQIVTAPGGILGNFATFTQPTSGLLPGTQFDTVFGSTSLSLYATPSSYSNIAAAGVASNNNRQQIGDILQPIRPTPGIRESNTARKFLFDSLAPQTTGSLPVAMDQLAGVGYGQIIGMNFENSKFLADQTASTVALHRRKEGKYLVAGDTESTLGEAREEFWGMAIARLSDWRGDNVGYNTYDVLGGIMAGVQKRFTPQSMAGLSLAYAGSSPSTSQSMGSGPMQNVQIMGYGSHELNDGFFVQGTLGGGGGTINASRNISMMGTSYTAQIQTANLAGSMMTGWGAEAANKIRYETGIGVNYLGMRHFGFNDSGNQSAYALTTQSGNTQSLVPNLNASASIPFKAGQIDWRAHGLVNVGYETAANKITLQSNFLGSPISVDSGSIGRTRLNLGLGLSGAVGRETRIALEVANQSAQNWNATAANVSLRVGF